MTMKVPMSDIIDLASEKDKDGNSNGFFAYTTIDSLPYSCSSA